jgi:hypothetical protein
MTGKPAASAVDDPQVRVRFLKAVEKLGCVSAAAALTGVSVRSFYRHRYKDPGFAEAWDDAVMIARGDLEDLLRRRFTEGVDYTVRRNGGVVTVTRKFSDRLGEYVHKVLERRAEKIEAKWDEDDKREETAKKQDIIEVARRISYLLAEGRRKALASGNPALIAESVAWEQDLNGRPDDTSQAAAGKPEGA